MDSRITHDVSVKPDIYHGKCQPHTDPSWVILLIDTITHGEYYSCYHSRYVELIYVSCRNPGEYDSKPPPPQTFPDII